MTIDDHSEFEDWDGAYVLGALSPADRRRFEAHLEVCARCRTAVAELAGIPGLLGRADPAALPDAHNPTAEAVPESAEKEPAPNLLDLTMYRLEAERSRRRMRWALLSAAAAVLVALAVILVPRVVDTDPPDVTAAMQPAVATQLTAALELRQVAWGTKIMVSCDYPDRSTWPDPDSPPSYVLDVTDSEGRTSQAATWNAVSDKQVTVDAATATRLGDIVTITIRTADGTTILSKDV
ncbi:zf-HC2 domain-containing protein [Brevibacterium sp. 2SA]|uniref:anti-sigma factor family protein n=1 Tax=Brevibacterium sp. 2SA TaxID=2502198 RepID=UPI0010F50551|nr:zf-HC2 domain-containing protein [Brevibacterium sp. 2SA]